jgi:polyphosphate kinase
MSDRLLNRELSWLDFNRRVLALAHETGIPPLERFEVRRDLFVQPR